MRINADIYLWSMMQRLHLLFGILHAELHVPRILQQGYHDFMVIPNRQAPFVERIKEKSEVLSSPGINRINWRKRRKTS